MAEEIKFQPLRQQPTDVSPTPDTLSATEVKKRKRVPDDQSAIFQPAKKSAGKKRRIDDDTDLDIENGVDKSYSSMDQQLLADYLAQKTRKFECDLSSIELEDRFISGMTGLQFMVGVANRFPSKSNKGYHSMVKGPNSQ